MGTLFRRRTLILASFFATGAAAAIVACTDSYQLPHSSGTGAAGSSSSHMGGGGGITFDGAGGSCDQTCSNDLKSVVDCKGQVITPCTVDQGCANGMCIDDPCMAAEQSKSSYGCDYYALKTAQRLQADGACFAVFVANTWGKAVHLTVERDGKPLQPGATPLKVSDFAYIPSSQGQTVTYTPYDDTAGLGVGQVAVLFISRLSSGSVINCPKTAALDEETGVAGTGLGKGFHIKSDVPVVAYQMVPFGGGTAGVTSATLLLPTTAWDTNYIAVNAYGSASNDGVPGGDPSLDIVAYKDNTTVTVLPKVDIVAGSGVMGATANTQVEYHLNAGQFLQITQPAELTGSVIQSTDPVGVFGAHACMDVPLGTKNCDSGQQQLPPVRALGSEYVAVRYRGRQGMDEAVPWRVVGAVDGTTLTWAPSDPPNAPKTINQGEVFEVTTPGPFVVKSQDGNHPFYLGGYMTGGGTSGNGFNGEGDPDWVNVVTPPQYLDDYVFFTDPTYPETNLVLVRTPSKVDGTFADVTLTCAGNATPITVPASDWTKIGSYEYARVDLMTGMFTSVNGCQNGRQELKSALPFGVTVWGWGHADVQTQNVSYAYPAGAGFQPINMVMVPPTPK